MVNFVKKTGFTALLVLIAFTIFLGASHEGRAAVKTTLFIPHVFNAGIKPLNWFTPTPVVERVTFPIPGGTGAGDIYRPPGEGPYAAVLLFLGVAPAGHDDPRVVRLGDALARSNMVTLFYWSPLMAKGRMEPEDVDNLVAAFQYLSAQEYVDATRVGMGGFCVGASFSIMAASAEPIRDQVAFVNAFGPYYDARDLLLQVASRSRYYQDQTDPWNPDSMTRKVFANELIEAMDDPQSRDILSRIFVEKQRVADEEVEGLSDQARAVHQLLTGTTREEAERLYLTLPADFREDMAEISPRSYVSDLEARIMIMHDRDDDLVPSAESRRLADALESRGDFRYTEVLAFDHVRPTSGGGLGSLLKEGYKLFKHMYGIVRVAT